MNLDEYVTRLKSVDDLSWVAGEYDETFGPTHRIPNMHRMLLDVVLEDGRRFADRKKKGPEQSLVQRMQKDGLSVEISDSGPLPSNGYWEFAYYLEPSAVRINRMLIDSVFSRIDQKIRDLLVVDWTDVFLAHEYAHFLGITAAEPPAYTDLVMNIYGQSKKEKRRLWGFLDESFAMSFAKGYLQMNFSPYLFDFLFLWLYDRKRALSLYGEVVGLV